jgi:hypothetical protein
MEYFRGYSEQDWKKMENNTEDDEAIARAIDQGEQELVNRKQFES